MMLSLAHFSTRIDRYGSALTRSELDSIADARGRLHSAAAQLEVAS